MNKKPPKIDVESWLEPERVVSLGRMPTERVSWLWPQRIPLGHVTLLAGEPQVGKSYLMMDLAARVTRGGPWPGSPSSAKSVLETDGVETETVYAPGSYGPHGLPRRSRPCAPSSVLLLCAEDNWQDTLSPRLDTFGADLKKIFLYQNNECGKTFDLSAQMDRLHAAVKDVQDCRLIVVDPVTSYLGKYNENSGTHVRRLLDPLTELAESRDIAIVLVTHLRRSTRKALHRPVGSDAFVRAVRSAWLVSEDANTPGRRLLLPIKQNLGPPPTGLAFRLEEVPGQDEARLTWETEPVLMKADDALCAASRRAPPRDHKLCDALAWLEETLAAGPVPAGEVQARAKADGISYGTLRRAFEALSVQTQKKDEPDGKSLQVWQLGIPRVAK